MALKEYLPFIEADVKLPQVIGLSPGVMAERALLHDYLSARHPELEVALIQERHHFAWWQDMVLGYEGAALSVRISI